MLDWLHDLPTWLGALVIAAVFIIPTMVGSFVLQPSIARQIRKDKVIQLSCIRNTPSARPREGGDPGLQQQRYW